FRARDPEGRCNLYLYRESKIIRLIGEGDQISTDIGVSRIFGHDNHTCFGGAPSISSRAVVIATTLTTPAKSGSEDLYSKAIVYIDLADKN
ncbi:MAG: hypothetical protein HQK54_15960, partial [Oligoflexales bacterium]|nr:hypothetical protein [Oligoflexales bacterium]